MCARRFLVVIFVLTLIVVAARFAIYPVGRQRARSSEATPQGPFRSGEAGGGPDYTRAVELGCAARHCRTTPRCGCPTASASASAGDAAVFYIHPTTYLERRPLERAAPAPAATRRSAPACSSRARRARSTAPGNLGAALSPGGVRRLPAQERGRQEALDFAYRDVVGRVRPIREGSRRPADHPRRPQPGRAAPRAAAAREGRRQADRAAARRGLCRRLADQHHRRPAARSACPPARRRDQTGCILSWMSFGDPANPVADPRRMAEDGGLNGGERAAGGHAVRQPDHRDRKTARRRRRTIPARWFRPRDLRRRRWQPGRSARIATRAC